MFGKLNPLTNAILYAILGVLLTTYGVITLFVMHQTMYLQNFALFAIGLALLFMSLSNSKTAWAELSGSAADKG